MQRQALLERHFPYKDLGAEAIPGILTALASRLIVVEGKEYSPQGNRISRSCSYCCIMYARVRLPTRFTLTTECD